MTRLPRSAFVVSILAAALGSMWRSARPVAAASARISLDAPTTVELGQPIELRIEVQGAANVGGYEGLRFGLAAQRSSPASRTPTTASRQPDVTPQPSVRSTAGGSQVWLLLVFGSQLYEEFRRAPPDGAIRQSPAGNGSAAAAAGGPAGDRARTRDGRRCGGPQGQPDLTPSVIVNVGGGPGPKVGHPDEQCLQAAGPLRCHAFPWQRRPDRGRACRQRRRSRGRPRVDPGSARHRRVRGADLRRRRRRLHHGW